jgi:lipopolysaccharide transport system permease protein
VSQHQQGTSEHWDQVITPKRGLFQTLHLRRVWDYRDLVALFIKRDLTATYAQTLLGPLWFFLQPIFTTIIFTFIFGNLAGLGNDGIPKPLFYMSGIVLWNYFAEVLMKTSDTFIANRHIFSKVYFPRLVIPISLTISHLMKLGIQLLLLFGLMIFYLVKGEITLSWTIVLFPLLIIPVAFLGLGCGLIVTALTTKYRDLKYLVNFGIELLRYASPVIFPLSTVAGKMKWALLANPMSAVIETFRHVCFHTGQFEWLYLAYSVVSSFLILLLGAVVFSFIEKDFIDTV